MILKKEFYFIRHGQTDHNLLEGKYKGDHPDDISLNETGINQAKLIQPIISALPIKSVCSSPLKRAQETKEIIAATHRVNHYAINDLGECSAQIWRDMTQFNMYSSFPNGSTVHQFMDQVRNGINEALSLPGPPLIVAHGGIHWAICCMISISAHDWAINNCIPVHFSIGDCGKWTAKKLAHDKL
jgi:probable phosphoglycerate mutase